MGRLLLSALILSAGLGGQASALEGCKTVQTSCSQMYATCEKVCSRLANPSRCMSMGCEISLPQCRSTGIWRSRNGSNGCWTTSNRG